MDLQRTLMHVLDVLRQESLDCFNNSVHVCAYRIIDFGD